MMKPASLQVYFAFVRIWGQEKDTYTHTHTQRERERERESNDHYFWQKCHKNAGVMRNVREWRPEVGDHSGRYHSYM